MSKHFYTFPSIVWLPHKFAVGPVYMKFFEGLKEEKLLGNRCSGCGKVFIPPKSFCPSCYIDIDEWVEVAQTGTVISWTIAVADFHGAPLKTPFVSALIKLDGTDCNFLHIIGEIDCQALIENRLSLTGKRVKTVWASEKRGTLLDLAYFKLLE